MKTKQTATIRSDFANERYLFYVKSWDKYQDAITGFKARKIAQAYRIYCHYLIISNPPAYFGRVEIHKAIRERKDRKDNFLRDERRNKLMDIHWK